MKEKVTSRNLRKSVLIAGLGGVAIVCFAASTGLSSRVTAQNIHVSTASSIPIPQVPTSLADKLMLALRCDPMIQSCRLSSESEGELGYYADGHATKYTSAYKDINERTKAEWICSLGTYFETQGGGWDKYQQACRNQPEATDEASRDSLTEIGLDRAMVPYDRLEKFADSFWSESSQLYSSSEKAQFRHEAIIDGISVWLQFRGWASSDYSSWRSAYLSQLLQNRP